MTRAIVSAGVLLALAAPAAAQREVTLAAPAAVTPDFLAVVSAEAAAFAEVSDTHRVLAVGRRPGTTPQVLLFALDAKGGVQTPPRPITLPRPGGLGPKRANYPLSLAFHPKLPLLYVWQDAAPPPRAEAGDAANLEFDHLCVYALDGAEPELLVSLCRGEDYALGQLAGCVGIDPAGKRLYLPNMRRAGARPPAAASVGTLDLGPDGLPADDAQKVEPTPADRAAARKLLLARIAAIKAGGKSAPAAKLTPADTTPFATFPAGTGFIPVGDSVTVVGGPYGPVTWDEGNRRARFHSLFVTPLIHHPADHRLVPHPTLPVAYGCRLKSTFAYRVEHADGYLTGLPQHVTVTGTDVLTRPVVLAKRQRLAFGGAGRVVFAGLDAEGAVTTAQEQAAVACQDGVNALAYSEANDRLYAVVGTTAPGKKK